MEKHGFYCPYCENQISEHDSDSEHPDSIRFWAEMEGNHFKFGSYIRLYSKLGVYGGAIESSDVTLEKGACVLFSCPYEACRKALTASYNTELSEIQWYDDNGKKHRIAFHNTLGKEMTFVIDAEEGELIASHGKHRLELVDRRTGYIEWG